MIISPKFLLQVLKDDEAGHLIPACFLYIAYDYRDWLKDHKETVKEP